MRRISSTMVGLAIASTAFAVPVVLTGSVASAAPAAGLKVGNCYRYDYLAWSGKSAPVAAPVPCKSAHKARTVAIGRFTADTTFAKSQNRDSKAWEVGDRACYSGRVKLLGGTDASRTKSAYTLTYFSPTKVQWDNGARWLRCDVSLRAKNVETAVIRLLDLPTATPYLSNGVSRKEKRCLEAEVTDYAGFSCANGFTGWEIKGTYKVAGAKFPTDQQFQAIAAKQCKRIIGSTNWWATWPGKVGWSLGQRHMGCYRDTHS